jgi:DNA repair exonuclease SbcCD ATPase subunit
MEEYKEFYKLLEICLTDGVITAKEREVLLKKAESLGMDPDEANLIIDAAQQKADNKVQTAVSKQRGKSCPFCGGAIPQLTDRCPHCGETISAEASEELLALLDKLEDALISFKTGQDVEKSRAEVEKYIRRANMYYENNPKVQKLLKEIAAEKVEAERRAKNAALTADVKNITKGVTGGLGKIILYVLIGIGVLIAIGMCSFAEEAYYFEDFYY